MKRSYFALPLVTKLLGLLVLFNMVNCGCGKIPANSIELNSNENSQGDNSPGPNAVINIELTGQDEVVDSDLITFKVKNKDTQELDLNRPMATITLSQKKGFDGKEINEGKIGYKMGGLTIKGGNSIQFPLVNVLGFDQLGAGQEASISLQLNEIENLASATISFQVKDAQGKILSQKETNWKLTSKMGPISEESTAVIGIKDSTVTFIGKTSLLKFEVEIENTSNHPINLKALNYMYVFEGDITGPLNFDMERYFATHNNILAQGNKIVFPLSLSISDPDTIQLFEKAINTNNLFIVSSLTMEGDYELATFRQQVKLISPDIEIGPIPGKSKIETALNNQGINFENRELKLPIKFTNLSEHDIDLEKADYSLKILQDNNLFFEINNQGENINWDTNILDKGGSFELSISLEEKISSSIISQYSTSKFSVNFIIRSKANGEVIGDSNQPLELKLGPIVGESTAGIAIENAIDLVYDEHAKKSSIVFKVKILNTSDHPINLKEALYNYQIIKIINTNQSEDILNRQFSGEALKNAQDIWLGKTESYTRTFPVSLTGMSLDQAEDFLKNNRLDFVLSMKTLDNSYALGTKRQVIERYNKK
jgi:hypothetical protein